MDADLRYPVLTDIDNGYALSLDLAIWVGAELERLMSAAGRDLAAYQGNEAWFMPIPATFVVAADGTVSTRFIDPDYRRRMTVEDLLAALKNAQKSSTEKPPCSTRACCNRRYPSCEPDGMNTAGTTRDSCIAYRIRPSGEPPRPGTAE